MSVLLPLQLYYIHGLSNSDHNICACLLYDMLSYIRLLLDTGS